LLASMRCGVPRSWSQHAGGCAPLRSQSIVYMQENCTSSAVCLSRGSHREECEERQVFVMLHDKFSKSWEISKFRAMTQDDRQKAPRGTPFSNFSTLVRRDPSSSPSRAFHSSAQSQCPACLVPALPGGFSCYCQHVPNRSPWGRIPRRELQVRAIFALHLS
jgi:hypothetical protein